MNIMVALMKFLSLNENNCIAVCSYFFREAQIEAGIIPRDSVEEGPTDRKTKETEEEEKEEEEEQTKKDEEDYVHFENPLSYLIKAVAVQNPKQFSLPPEMMQHAPLPGEWSSPRRSRLNCPTLAKGSKWQKWHLL